jgi:hypothetical protein
MAAEGTAAVENTWLAQYPKPVRIATDQGPRFGQDFTDMWDKNGITHSLRLLAIFEAIPSPNPSTRQLLKFYVLLLPLRTKNPFTKENKPFTRHLLLLWMFAVVHAFQVRATTHLVPSHFNRDMFLDIAPYADILAIRNN